MQLLLALISLSTLVLARPVQLVLGNGVQVAGPPSTHILIEVVGVQITPTVSKHWHASNKDLTPADTPAEEMYALMESFEKDVTSLKDELENLEDGVDFAQQFMKDSPDDSFEPLADAINEASRNLDSVGDVDDEDEIEGLEEAFRDIAYDAQATADLLNDRKDEFKFWDDEKPDFVDAIENYADALYSFGGNLGSRIESDITSKNAETVYKALLKFAKSL